MPSEYSYVHGQPNYWRVRFDDWNGWEAPHIHARQGDRELQVYVQTLAIKNQNGRFTNEEIEEIKRIAQSYANNYCLSIHEEMFSLENTELNKLMMLKKIFSSSNEKTSHVK